MEWIGAALTGFLVVMAVAQLFWAYALSAIAKKTDQSELMQVLAWIPILQTAPMLSVGGSGIGRFLIGAIALVVGNLTLIGVATFLGNGFGDGLAGLGIGLSSLLCLVYFARVTCNTAIARDLPWWLGLLIFIPILNFFLYPLCAFHDGWTSPNKIGLAIGTVLIIGSTMPAIHMARLLNEEGGIAPELLLALSGSSLADSDSANSLESGPFAELASQLILFNDQSYDLPLSESPIEGAIENPIQSALHDQQTLGDIDRSSPRSIRSFGVSATPPEHPYSVQASDDCPQGTELRSKKTDNGEDEWCQQLAVYGGLRHGWYAHYRNDGRPESLGQYEDGLRVGVWTRLYPTGEVRAQAEFRRGLQHGWVLTFDEVGNRTQSARFKDGVRFALN